MLRYVERKDDQSKEKNTAEIAKKDAVTGQRGVRVAKRNNTQPRDSWCAKLKPWDPDNFFPCLDNCEIIRQRLGENKAMQERCRGARPIPCWG